MVLILDGNSELVAHAVRKNVFYEKKIMTDLDLIKRLEQIK